MPAAPKSTSSLRWDDLRLVLAVSEHGTISRAASSLGLSHPTLSRRLRDLESQLGVRLFDRTPATFRLTEAGEEMCRLALRMRDDIFELERRIAGRDRHPSGPVRLTAPDAIAEYLLPPILAEVCRAAPELTIELTVSNQVLSLAQRSADMALRVTDRPDPALRGRRVGAVAMAVYAARSGAARDRPAEGDDWIGFDAALACTGPGTWVKETVAEDRIRFRANTLLAAAQAIRAGIGRGVLPCFVGGNLPDVERVGAPIPGLTVGLWLLVHPELAQVPRVRRASDAIARRIRTVAPLLSGEAR